MKCQYVHPSDVKLSNQHLVNFLSSTTEPPALGNGSGLPSSIVDVWEFLGKSIESQYTWDTLINTNLVSGYASVTGKSLPEALILASIKVHIF